MAFPTPELINGLRAAAGELRNGAYYAWGHHGACNCGHLLQATTQLSKEEILTYAHTGPGEWTELAEEACAVTGKSWDLHPSIFITSNTSKTGKCSGICPAVSDGYGVTSARM